MTSDGGTSWAHSVGTPAAIVARGTCHGRGHSCRSTQECFVVGSETPGDGSPSGRVFATDDGGLQWVLQALPVTTTSLLGISCPSTTDCVAVGGGVPPRGGPGQAMIVTTTNGGNDWAARRQMAPANSAVLRVRPRTAVSPSGLGQRVPWWRPPQTGEPPGALLRPELRAMLHWDRPVLHTPVCAGRVRHVPALEVTHRACPVPVPGSSAEVAPVRGDGVMLARSCRMRCAARRPARSASITIVTSRSSNPRAQALTQAVIRQERRGPASRGAGAKVMSGGTSAVLRPFAGAGRPCAFTTAPPETRGGDSEVVLRGGIRRNGGSRACGPPVRHRCP